MRLQSGDQKQKGIIFLGLLFDISYLVQSQVQKFYVSLILLAAAMKKVVALEREENEQVICYAIIDAIGIPCLPV